MWASFKVMSRILPKLDLDCGGTDIISKGMMFLYKCCFSSRRKHVSNMAQRPPPSYFITDSPQS
jgi:hypothetical protein